MDEYFKKISQILERHSLTERERTDMRLHLTVFIDENPAVAPLSARLTDRISNIFASSHLHFGSRTLAAALAVVLVVGIGTSYAAQTALPGSPLYSVKLAVNEPIERATVASNQSETQWDVTLTTRRLEEAEKLAASGDLSSSTAAIVETQVNADTQDFNQHVAALAASSTATVQVANAQSDFEAALSANVQVLAALASSTPEVQGQVAPLLAVVRTHAAEARTARIAALENIDTGSASTSMEIAASMEKQAATASLVSIKALASSSSSGNASSTVQTDTEQAISNGDSNLANGHFRQAFSAFQSAVRAATEAQVSAQAQYNLGVSVTLPAVIPIDTATSTDATATSSAASSASTTQDINTGM